MSRHQAFDDSPSRFSPIFRNCSRVNQYSVHRGSHVDSLVTYWLGRLSSIKNPASRPTLQSFSGAPIQAIFSSSSVFSRDALLSAVSAFFKVELLGLLSLLFWGLFCCIQLPKKPVCGFFLVTLAVFKLKVDGSAAFFNQRLYDAEQMAVVNGRFLVQPNGHLQRTVSILSWAVEYLIRTKL